MGTTKPNELVINNFKVPVWAGKPAPGLHLDVLKEGKLIQKLMIDEKCCYFFGRNRQLCEFSIDHQSCSRVHAVLVWHKFLSRAFLVDLDSVHGTYIGKIKLEPQKPQQVPIDSELHFGASTRVYILRERPNPLYNMSGIPSDTSLQTKDVNNAIGPENRTSDLGDGSALGLLYSQLPQSEVELDNLTEFNTAHNKRLSSIVDVSSNPTARLPKIRKRPILNVHFSDADEVINPEDIDPSVGRFRNLVQETFIPNKRAKGSHEGASLGVAAPDLYNTVKASGANNSKESGNFATPLSTSNLVNTTNLFGPTYALAVKLGLPLPNLAPDVDNEPQEPSLPPSLAILHASAHSKPTANLLKLNANNMLTSADVDGTSGGLDSGLVEMNEPKKKKYAKESWPGKRPGFLVGPVA